MTRFLVLLALACCSCQTNLYDRTTGKKIASFTEDAQETLYQDGNTLFHEIGMNHSMPTTAALSGTNQIISTVTTAAVSAYALHGLGPGTTAPRYIAPAAPVATSAVHHKYGATPTPTPKTQALLHKP